MRGVGMQAPMTRRSAVGRLAMAGLIPAMAASPLLAGVARAADDPAIDLASTSALLRVMFPHPRLDAAFYDGIARAYLEGVTATPAAAEHKRGLALLDGSYIAPFAELPGVIQRSMVARYDQEPFFKALRNRAVELIYRDGRVWKMVGYEGSAVEYGGYINRGFNDIDWLPRGGGAK